MRRFHQVFGWFMFVAFVLTGQYMAIYHNHLHGVPDGLRMLYRSRHIYILFAALLNIGIGIYFSWAAERWRRVLQSVGSVLIATATLLLVPAFFYDSPRGPDHTILSRIGIIMTALGVLLHFVGGPRSSLQYRER